MTTTVYVRRDVLALLHKKDGGNQWEAQMECGHSQAWLSVDGNSQRQSPPESLSCETCSARALTALEALEVAGK